jgi:hypothetical protein
MPDNITQKQEQDSVEQALNDLQKDATFSSGESIKDDMNNGQVEEMITVPDIFGLLIWLAPGNEVSIAVQTGHSLILKADGTHGGCNYITSLVHGTQHLNPNQSTKWGPNRGGTITVTVKNEGPGRLQATA